MAQNSWDVREILPVSVIFGTAVLLVYYQIFDHEFLTSWDDGLYVVNNEAAHGFSITNLKQAFSRTFVGNYAPLHIISYMIDFHLWGMKPGGYLAVNLILHTANALLLYLLLRGFGSRSIWAVCGSLLFLLHPVQVETVAWVSQRKTLLALFFFLSAIYAYHNSRNREKPLSENYYYASILLYAFAVLSKSVAIIFPLFILLHEYCINRSLSTVKSLIRIIPFAVISVIVGILALWSQSFEQGGGIVDRWGGSSLATFFTMLPVLVSYLKMLILPINLNAVYMPAIKTSIDSEVLISGIILLGICLAGILLAMKQRRLFLWYALFFAGLMPVSQIVPLTTLMNDRYLYFPMIGAAGLYALFMSDITEKYSRFFRNTLLIITLFIISVLGFISHNRSDVWRDDITLWRATARSVPEHAEVWYNLGRSLQGRGRLDESITPYLRTLSRVPFHRKAFDNLAVIFTSSPEFQKNKSAIIHNLVTQLPAYPQGMYLLGHSGKSWEYMEFHQQLFTKLATFNNKSPNSLLGLGNICLRLNKLENARIIFDKALSTGAAPAEVEYNQACIMALDGNSSDAINLLKKCVPILGLTSEQLKNDRYFSTIQSDPQFAAIASSLDK